VSVAAIGSGRMGDAIGDEALSEGAGGAFA